MLLPGNSADKKNAKVAVQGTERVAYRLPVSQAQLVIFFIFLYLRLYCSFRCLCVLLVC